MSRYGDDYNDRSPNRWDRSRFEQMRYERQDPRPRRQVLVEERPARPRYAEDRVEAPRFASRVRREIFEDDFRETNDRALQPYRNEREQDFVIDIERRRERVEEAPRPGIRRRQSSLDTYDRRPQTRYVQEVRERTPPRRVYQDNEYLSPRRREEPVREEVREVEIIREREIGSRPRARSDVRSVLSDARSSHRSRASLSSSSRTASISPGPARTVGKKGHTKLPKQHYKGIAVRRFCDEYDITYSDEGDFFKVSRALGKDYIDQILVWSREMHEPRGSDDRHDRYETIRTEWINPPSVIRAPSPARSARIVRASSPSPEREEIKVTTQTTQAGGIPPPPITLQTQGQYVPHTHQPLSLTVQQRPAERSSEDIEAEIRRLTLERDIVKLERGGYSQPGQQIIIQEGHYQPRQEYSVAKFKPGHHKSKSSSGGDVFFVDNVDNYKPAKEEKKKDKKPSARAAAIMMASLT